MQISDIGTAARNLADYIDLKGDQADLRVVSAQAGLIFGHVTELQDRKAAMVDSWAEDNLPLWGEL